MKPVDYRLEYYNSVVPQGEYWTIDNLQPSSKSFMPLDKQRSAIKRIQAYPERGFAFLTPTGFGKSTFLYALFHAALERHKDFSFNLTDIYIQKYCPVVFIEAAPYLEEVERWKYRDGRTPILTENKIRRMREKNIPFTVIIDEFEKVRKSVFRMEESYRLLQALYKSRHLCQLIIAGNLTKQELRDTQLYAEGTYRRIEEMTTPHFWELSNKPEVLAP